MLSIAVLLAIGPTSKDLLHMFNCFRDLIYAPSHHLIAQLTIVISQSLSPCHLPLIRWSKLEESMRDQLNSQLDEYKELLTAGTQRDRDRDRDPASRSKGFRSAVAVIVIV